jgi:hypothetical protein
MRWGACGVWGLLVSGCVGPEETQFLTLAPRSPEVEARSYDFHDPFPDKLAGPDTYSRPRSFITPRESGRTLLDLRFLLAMHPTAGQPQLAAVPVAAVPMVSGPARPGPGGRPIPTGSPIANYPFPPGQPVPVVYHPATPLPVR